MTNEVKFTIQSLFNDCVSQSSIDFSALRVQRPDLADTVYGDYVISPDKYAEFRSALDTELSVFASCIRGSIVYFSDDDDSLLWRIQLGEEAIAFADVVQSIIFSYLKYRMLVWWFTGRNEQLQIYYSERASSAKSNIMNLIGGSLCSRPLRYF